jgi:hypothetical protein
VCGPLSPLPRPPLQRRNTVGGGMLGPLQCCRAAAASTPRGQTRLCGMEWGGGAWEGTQTENRKMAEQNQQTSGGGPSTRLAKSNCCRQVWEARLDFCRTFRADSESSFLIISGTRHCRLFEKPAPPSRHREGALLKWRDTEGVLAAKSLSHASAEG